MPRLWTDTETFSTIALSSGVHKYAEAGEVMLFQWALEDGPVHVWDRTADQDIPNQLIDDAMLADEVWAHNAMFDTTMVRETAPDVWALLGGDIELWRCSMVMAYSHALPGSLAELCDVLRVSTEDMKDKEGKALMLFFCKPGPDGQRRTRHTDPEKWARLVSYAGQDIRAMRACVKRMPMVNYPVRQEDLDLWRLDQRVNTRGIQIDLDFAREAVTAVAATQKRLGAEVADATSNRVESATKRDQLLRYLIVEYGYSEDDLQASTIDRILADPDLPDGLRELLKLRREASSSSVAKYRKVVACAGRDGRLRGTQQFRGAGRTGRVAHRLVQPGNMPRPTLGRDAIEAGIEAIKTGCAELILPNLMKVAASAVRGIIVAPPGRKLVVSDLANIEGRTVAWLAGEDWKLQAFRDYDTILGHDAKGKAIRKGPDLYNVSYSKAFGIEVDAVGSSERQIGKVMELMLGYEGGVGAFITGAASYNIDLDAMAETALPTVPDDVLAEARGFYQWRRRKKLTNYGLTAETFIACESLKRLWRRAHVHVESLWPELKDAAVTAIRNPGERVDVRGKLTFYRRKAWLYMVLPSGRALCYPGAQVNDKGEISYMGVNQYSRKWTRLKTYGGKLLENASQASSCDVMTWGQQPAEDEGYEVVLTVHDELVTEAPDEDEHSAARLAEIMAVNPPWAGGMPLAAAGFEAYRYGKH